MDKLKKLDMLDDLKKEISAVKMALEGLTLIKVEMEKLRKENEEQRSRIDVLEDSLDYLENQSRRDNLVIRGIPEKKGETWEDCANEVLEVANLMEVAMSRNDIVRAHRVNGAKTSRPIVVKLMSWQVREELLENSKKLKGTEIFVMEDFSRKVINERRELLAVARVKRQNKQFAMVRFNKLFTNDGIFKFNLRQNKLEKIAGGQESAGMKRKRNEMVHGDSPKQEDKIIRPDADNEEVVEDLFSSNSKEDSVKLKN